MSASVSHLKMLHAKYIITTQATFLITISYQTSIKKKNTVDIVDQEVQNATFMYIIKTQSSTSCLYCKNDEGPCLSFQGIRTM